MCPDDLREVSTRSPAANYFDTERRGGGVLQPPRLLASMWRL